MTARLYEVISWGNDSDDPFTGGPNGPDTCYVVRAASPEAAAALVDQEFATNYMGSPERRARAVYLMGTDAGSDAAPRILRGPYVEHAYCYGWQKWYRETADEPWSESR